MPLKSKKYSRKPVEIIYKKLYETLPDIAREIISSDWYEQSDDPYRKEFLINPDNYLQHESDWHQWGIITHTIMTGRYLKQKVPIMLETWFSKTSVNTKCGLALECIDGQNKWDLFMLSIPLHDCGKFSARHYLGLKRDEKRPDFDFHGHENKSGKIIRAWKDRFQDYGLTEKQIEYIACCTELHYELGKIRKIAKNSQMGYTVAFTESQDFQRATNDIMLINKEFAREIGIMFIADSLGKTDFHQKIFTTDLEILSQRDELETEIKKRFPGRPEMIDVALQLPINIAVGYQYLKLVITTYD